MSRDIEILAERLDRLCNDLEAHTRLDEERWSEMREDIKVIRHVVTDGNGSPSLTVQVARNAEKIAAIEPIVKKVADIADDGKFDTKTKGAVIISLLALIGALGVPLLQYLLR